MLFSFLLKNRQRNTSENLIAGLILLGKTTLKSLSYSSSLLQLQFIEKHLLTGSLCRKLQTELRFQTMHLSASRLDVSCLTLGTFRENSCFSPVN